MIFFILTGPIKVPRPFLLRCDTPTWRPVLRRKRIILWTRSRSWCPTTTPNRWGHGKGHANTALLFLYPHTQSHKPLSMNRFISSWQSPCCMCINSVQVHTISFFVHYIFIFSFDDFLWQNFSLILKSFKLLNFFYLFHKEKKYKIWLKKSLSKVVIDCLII